MAQQATPPKLLAVVICESVVEDIRSRNKSILNAYNFIWAPRFPTSQDRLTIFVSMTDGRGVVPVEIRIIRETSGGWQPVVQVVGQANFPDPLASIDMVMDLRQVPIPAAGNYAVQVYAAGTMIGERRFGARQMNVTPQAQGGQQP